MINLKLKSPINSPHQINKEEGMFLSYLNLPKFYHIYLLKESKKVVFLHEMRNYKSYL